MRKILSYIMIMLLVFSNAHEVIAKNVTEEYLDIDYEVNLKQDLLCLMLAYPEHISGIELNVDGLVYVIMNSGKKILYDDKKNKTYDEKISNADLQDSLEQIYPLYDINGVMEEGKDPGRFRCYELFGEVYGKERNKIEENLEKVKIGYKNYLFNKNNSCSENLINAMNDVKILIENKKDIKENIFPCNGTYNYRYIDDMGVLSSHAYGIAIDLAYKQGDYWKWSTKEEGENRIKVYPKELVKIFENNNFIWGGKWNRYDSFHYEYRPELILKSLYFGDKNNTEQLWYKGAPIKEEKVKECIDKINTTLSNKEYSEEDICNILIKIIKNRNKALISKDLENIDSMYDKNTKYGLWAYEFEKRKMDYIDNWQKKQGAKFIEINPDVVIRKITKKGKDMYSANVTCSTEYKYIYEGSPDAINICKTGTYHVIRLVNKKGTWVIAREWYKDPFGDLLDMKEKNVSEISSFIKGQEEREFSDLNERRKNAMEYAFKYLGAANNKENGYQYNKKYRNYNSEGGDCANFASQILHEGGKFKKTKAWCYDGKGATRGWVNADGFKEYMIKSGRASVIAYGNYEKVYKSAYKLLPGDFVAYEKKGDITHISVVTGADSKGYPLVSCHNADRNNVPWDLGWSNEIIKFWIVRVHY